MNSTNNTPDLQAMGLDDLKELRVAITKEITRRTKGIKATFFKLKRMEKAKQP